MKRFLPKMYKKNIFDINYDKLKEKGIKILLFDFDNTIIEKGNYKTNNKTKELIDLLKKDFTIYVMSNSLNKNKLDKVCGKYGIPYINNSRKPFKLGFKKLKTNVSNEEIALIGDQLLTDIWGASRMNYYPVLTDPISENELVWTKFNRVLEKLIIKFNKNTIKRGEYYE